jgi:hypothetical protein
MGQCTSDSIAMTQYLKRIEPDDKRKMAARESLQESRGAQTSTNRLSDRPTYAAKNASIERRLRGRARIKPENGGVNSPFNSSFNYPALNAPAVGVIRPGLAQVGRIRSFKRSGNNTDFKKGDHYEQVL